MMNFVFDRDFETTGTSGLEEQDRGLCRAAGDFISIHDTDFRIMYQNRASIDMIGSQNGEYCYRAYGDRDGVCPDCPMDLCFNDGNVHTRERESSGSGRRSRFEITASPMIDSSGKIIGGVEVVRNMTVFSKAEISLDKEMGTVKNVEEGPGLSQKDWEDTFNSIIDVITIHDKDFNIIAANKAAEDMLKLTGPDMILNSKCYKYYHGTDSPPENCPSCRSLETGETVVSELFEPHLQKFIEIRVIPRLNENNEIIGLIHVVRDIGQRKAAEETIRIQLEHLNALRTIDKGILGSVDLNVTLEIFVGQVKQELNIDAINILLLDKHSLYLSHVVSRGFYTNALKYTRLKMGEGHAGRAAMERRTIIVPDINNEPDSFSRSEAMAEEGFVTYIAVPLITKGQVIGVMELFNRTLLSPDRIWMDFLGMVADQGALAIENATLFQDLHRLNREVNIAYDTTIEGWSRAMDMRDKETEGHSRRVTEMTMKVARYLGIKEKDILNIRRGALLHDLGKLGIPDSILLKPGKLDREEWKIMKLHPVYARDLLSPIDYLKPAIDIPYYHHEKWDGSGYPEGLKGEAIPLSARMFAVVDVWDALGSDRPYRPAWPEEKIIDHIQSQSGSHFDPVVVEAFMKLLQDGN